MIMESETPRLFGKRLFHPLTWKGCNDESANR